MGTRDYIFLNPGSDCGHRFQKFTAIILTFADTSSVISAAWHVHCLCETCFVLQYNGVWIRLMQLRHNNNDNGCVSDCNPGILNPANFESRDWWHTNSGFSGLQKFVRIVLVWVLNDANYNYSCIKNKILNVH